MTLIPEQLASLNSASLDTAMRLAGTAMQGMQDLVNVQLQAVHAAFDEGAKAARGLATASNTKDLSTLQLALVQPDLPGAAAYAKKVYAVASTTHSEMNRLIEGQLALVNEAVSAQLDTVAQSAPGGTNLAVTMLKSALGATTANFANAAQIARQLSKAAEASLDNMQGTKQKAA